MYAALVLGVEAPDVGPSRSGLQHHGDSVQRVMARVEDVSRHLDRRAAVLVERAGEVGRDRLGRLSLDLMPVDEVYDLAVAEQRHGGRAWRVVSEILAS